MRRLKRNPRQRRTRTKWMNTLKSIMIIPLCTLTVLITPALAQHVPFRCSVKFDKDFYMPGEKVTIYGTVTFNDNPVEGAKVVVNIKDFGLSGLEATTDSNGNWTLNFRVPDNQKFGTWLVEVEVTYKENSIKMLQKIRIGDASEINEVEILKSRIAELNRENMELKDENQRLQDQILRFIKQGKLIIGVCNGFQLMVKLGILPGLDGDYLNQKVTLTFNDSAKFEDRWVTLKINEHSPCIFLNGLNKLELPVRHGEGKFITKDEKTMERIKRKNLIAVQYIDIESGKPTQSYPYNPNGSIEAVAGICDETGHLFGLMPHPEAYLHYTNHPLWTRKKLPKEGEGIKIFRNGIKFIRKYL